MELKLNLNLVSECASMNATSLPARDLPGLVLSSLLNAWFAGGGSTSAPFLSPYSTIANHIAAENTLAERIAIIQAAFHSNPSQWHLTYYPPPGQKVDYGPASIFIVNGTTGAAKVLPIVLTSINCSASIIERSMGVKLRNPASDSLGLGITHIRGSHLTGSPGIVTPYVLPTLTGMKADVVQDWGTDRVNPSPTSFISISDPTNVGFPGVQISSWASVMQNATPVGASMVAITASAPTLDPINPSDYSSTLKPSFSLNFVITLQVLGLSTFPNDAIIFANLPYGVPTLTVSEDESHYMHCAMTRGIPMPVLTGIMPSRETSIQYYGMVASSFVFNGVSSSVSSSVGMSIMPNTKTTVTLTGSI